MKRKKNELEIMIDAAISRSGVTRQYLMVESCGGKNPYYDRLNNPEKLRFGEAARMMECLRMNKEQRIAFLLQAIEECME